MSPGPQIIKALLVVFAAAAVQGASGFGFALTAVGPLSLMTELTSVTPLIALLNAPVTGYVLLRLRRHVSARRVLPLVSGVAIGTPFGVHVLVNWPREVLLRGLAVVLVIAAVRAGRAGLRNGPSDGAPHHEPRHGTALALLAGVASGALGGAFGTSGPPLIAYVYSMPWSKEQRTATLQACFTASVVLGMVMFAARGLYTAELLTTAAWCMPGSLIGMLVGYAAFKRIPARGLELFVSVFLVVIAVRLFISG
ncbi:MAG: sulfite exporter TauE/SafE family protein [Armatimonadetes bacterium]|nr:sulfite exporter TauE/SafE family protein [Armatimonadota bacterium]